MPKTAEQIHLTIMHPCAANIKLQTSKVVFQVKWFIYDGHIDMVDDFFYEQTFLSGLCISLAELCWGLWSHDKNVPCHMDNIMGNTISATGFQIKYGFKKFAWLSRCNKY